MRDKMDSLIGECSSLILSLCTVSRIGLIDSQGSYPYYRIDGLKESMDRLVDCFAGLEIELKQAVKDNEESKEKDSGTL